LTLTSLIYPEAGTGAMVFREAAGRPGWTATP
jgi:hypothetical protein